MTWDHLKAAYKAAEGLDVHSRTVLLDLAKLADGKGRCWPAQTWLSRHPAMGVTKVKEALSVLVEAGLITKQTGERQARQKWASNVYVLHLSNAAEKPSTVVATRPRSGPHRSRDAATVPWSPRGHKLDTTTKAGGSLEQTTRRDVDVGLSGPDIPTAANDGPDLKLISGGRVA